MPKKKKLLKCFIELRASAIAWLPVTFSIQVTHIHITLRVTLNHLMQ